MKEELEAKLKDIKKKMPGIEELFKERSGGYNEIVVSQSVWDFDYMETEKYHLVAAKWRQQIYEEHGRSGIECIDWIALYYKEKGKDDPIREIKAEAVKVRDMYDAHKDRNEFKALNKVKIAKAEDEKIIVYWCIDHIDKIDKGVKYEFDLKKKIACTLQMPLPE